MTLTGDIGIQVGHNDQPFSYGTRGDNRQRNARGNRVIKGASSYQPFSLLHRCWLREAFRRISWN